VVLPPPFTGIAALARYGRPRRGGGEGPGEHRGRCASRDGSAAASRAGGARPCAPATSLPRDLDGALSSADDLASGLPSVAGCRLLRLHTLAGAAVGSQGVGTKRGVDHAVRRLPAGAAGTAVGRLVVRALAAQAADRRLDVGSDGDPAGARSGWP